MADEQDRAEALDDDVKADPDPDRLPGAQAYGAAGAEPHAGESVVRRAAREQPERPPRSPSGLVDRDPTLHDVATEREAPPPAEEQAMHAAASGGPIALEAIEDEDLRAPDRR